MAATLNLGTGGNWATKEDSLLAYNSENGNFKPLPFDFTRSTSATRVNKQGLIEVVSNNEPRIDFLNDSKGALKLEPSRSNLIIYSQNFNSWSKSGTVNVETGVLSPAGDNSASTLSGSGDLIISASTSVASTHIFSIWAKGNIGDTFRFQKTGGFSYAQNNITLDSSDWKRYEISRDFNVANGQITIDSFDEGISFWGAQLEAGSYATSYIPTQGAIATRVAESCINENLNVDYSGDYTLYLEHETLSLTEYNQFQFRQETSISYIFRVGNSLNVGTNLYTAANTIGFNKFALSVTSIGSYKFYKNGVLLSSGSGLNANL